MSDVHGEIREEEEEELEAERDIKRRVALSQIRQYPDPVLRMRAKPVETFDADLRRLVERMAALMVDAVGVGLAATQVGILQRLFVFSPGAEQEPAAVVNPVVTVVGNEHATEDEGCLSLQGVLAPVERAVSVRLEGKGVDGKDVSYELEGYPARTAQHELDHLDGVLIIDRTTPEARREAMAILRPRVVLA